MAGGFRGTKIKVGKEDPAEDVERIAAVRQALGLNRPLMVDANERFTHAEAIKRACGNNLTCSGSKNRYLPRT